MTEKQLDELAKQTVKEFNASKKAREPLKGQKVGKHYRVLEEGDGFELEILIPANRVIERVE